MIERLSSARLLLQPPNPLVLTSERTRLDCGCTVYIGVRVDKGEVATVAIACSADHDPITRRFNVALFDSLEHPSDRPLVDVCDELLKAAAA